MAKQKGKGKEFAPKTAPTPKIPSTEITVIPGETAKTTWRGHAKQIPAQAKALGMKAKAHVGRNKAAYIAGGLGAAGLAAGTTGIALAGRKKNTPNEG